MAAVDGGSGGGKRVHGARAAGSRRVLAAIPISLLILVGAGASLRSHYLLRQDRELLVHSYQVVRAADQVLIDALDAETGQRGFIITGDAAFLSPYERASGDAVPHDLADLQDLVADSRAQTASVRALRAAIMNKMSELEATVRARRAGGFAAARSVVADSRGKQSMDAIRVLKQRIQDGEERLLAARSAEVDRDERRIIAILIVTTALSIVSRFCIAVWSQRREAKAAAR